MNEEKKDEIVAVKIEYTKTTFKKNEDNTTIPEKTDRVYYYIKKWYDKSELDWGNYWDYCEGESIYPYSDDNGFVSDDFGMIYDRIDCNIDLICKIDKIVKVGDFIELENKTTSNEYFIRMTALGERPKLDASKFDYSDVNYEAAHCVLVYGKPLLEDCFISDYNRLWRTDFNDFVLSLIREKAGVPSAEINWSRKSGNYISINASDSFMKLSVNADSLDDIKTILRNLGAREIDDALVKSEYVFGNDNAGIRRVHADIVISTGPMN